MCINNALILQFMPLANKLAYKKKRLLPKHIDIEELQSAAYLGLVEAASRFDDTKGVAFSTYAYPRIFGAINDYLRSLGSMVTNFDNDEIVLEEILVAKQEDNCEEALEVVTKDFNGQAKSVMKMYFIDDFSMKEVGERFGVSESRISQLLSGYKNNIKQTWTYDSLSEELAA